MAKKMTAAKGGFKLRKIFAELETPEAKAPADRDGNKYGLANGLVITHFINQLFYDNYERGLTDDELEAAIREEYPNRETLQTMTSYRQYYNGGIHGFGQGEPLDKEYRLYQVRPAGEEKEEKPAKKTVAAKADKPAAKSKAAPKKAAKKAVKAGK